MPLVILLLLLGVSYFLLHSPRAKGNRAMERLQRPDTEPPASEPAAETVAVPETAAAPETAPVPETAPASETAPALETETAVGPETTPAPETAPAPEPVASADDAIRRAADATL